METISPRHRPAPSCDDVVSHYSTTNRALFLTLFMCLFWLAGAPQPAAGASDDLVLYFDTNSAELSDKARGKLDAYMRGVGLGKAGKVLVVGHADDKGKSKHNRTLSRKRARTVQKTLVESLGTPTERVLVIGQGNDDPIAVNDTDRGRARNRRVVVRLVGVAPPDLQRRYGAQDPRLAQMDILLADADAKLRLGQYAEALIHLDRAAELGGDQYARWQTRYGIAGFMGGQPPHKLRSYFEKALALDPHDTDARDFLGRLEAREAILTGCVDPSMGRTPQGAIKVTTRSQQHEYLRLFEVKPLAHHTLAQGTIDVWTCRTGQNRTITYYFDTTATLNWAFPAKGGRS